MIYVGVYSSLLHIVAIMFDFVETTTNKHGRKHHAAINES